jgi:hypothetical protein
MRDLPMPGSPEIKTTCPSPPLACSHRRRSRSISSSRPTSGVMAEMLLAKDHDVIEPVPPDGSDQADRIAAERCPDHVVIFGERHLRHLLNSYQPYYLPTVLCTIMRFVCTYR